jgi:HSP20 family protein
MDAWREDGRFVIALDLPGIPPEAIDIEARGRTITVTAERRPAPRGRDARTQLAERAHGVFTRRIQLAETLDAGGIEAGCEDGVLTLTVPVASASRPRRITVRAGQSPQFADQNGAAVPTAA